MYFRPSPKSTPCACCGKDGVIGLWIICYATIAKMPKTTRLPEAKVWIGSPIIVVNAAASDASLNKPSPTGNGRNPWCMPMMNHTPCGLGTPCPKTVIINADFFSIFPRPCRWLFTREVPKAWTRMSNDYVTCMVIRVWSSSHPVTLEPSPSHPWPSPTWTLPHPPSPRWRFDWVDMSPIPSPSSMYHAIITWSSLRPWSWRWGILTSYASMCWAVRDRVWPWLRY